MKEELLENLMLIAGQITVGGFFHDLLTSNELKLMCHCRTIAAVGDVLPDEEIKRELDELENLVKRRSDLKEEVKYADSEKERLSRFLDLKYWQLERVRKMYSLIKNGKAKTLQQAIALTE